MNDKKFLQYENNKSKVKKQDQLGLFSENEHKIIQEFKKINVNKISPIEALNILSNLKDRYEI